MPACRRLVESPRVGEEHLAAGGHRTPPRNAAQFMDCCVAGNITIPTASMTWGARKHGSVSNVTMTPQPSRWRRFGGGGRWAQAVTPRRASCSLSPMRAEPTGIARARRSRGFSSLPTTRRGACTSASFFPPGTSKWNKIEHRLFCHITHNCRGKPLHTFETVVDPISNTRTDAAQRVRAELDTETYPKGMTATDALMKALSLHRDEFRCDWNYELRPR